MDEPSGRDEFAMRLRSKHTNRRVKRTLPASGRKPVQRISARDVSMTADELQAFHRAFQPLFQRREQRAGSLVYLYGLLSDLERKTVEPMVLELPGANPNAIRGLQQSPVSKKALHSPQPRLGSSWHAPSATTSSASLTSLQFCATVNLAKDASYRSHAKRTRSRLQK
jgi:hypothetical protein